MESNLPIFISFGIILHHYRKHYIIKIESTRKIIQLVILIITKHGHYFFLELPLV